MAEKPGKGGTGGKTRADRLAEALRENLKKRKAQARRRAEHDKAEARPAQAPSRGRDPDAT